MISYECIIAAVACNRGARRPQERIRCSVYYTTRNDNIIIIAIHDEDHPPLQCMETIELFLTVYRLPRKHDIPGDIVGFTYQVVSKQCFSFILIIFEFLLFWTL